MNTDTDESGEPLWAYASETGGGLDPLGFKLADIRCVPVAGRSASFRRHNQTWIPDEGIAERVILTRPQCGVDLIVVRAPDSPDDEALSRLRDGGHLLFTGPSAATVARNGFTEIDGFAEIGQGGQLWRKSCPRSRRASRPVRSPEPSSGGDTLAARQSQADLVESHIRLARSLARRFSHHGESKDDLEQVALLALVKAARRFDPGRETCFSTYATASVLGEIKRHFRDKTWMLRVPRSIQELYLRVKDAREELTNTLGRSPTIQQIAGHIGATDEQVLEAIEAGDNYWPESLDVGVYEGETVREIPITDNGFDLAVDRHQLQQALPLLDERERFILKRLFYDGQTQRMVATEIGVSQMQVSRLLQSTVSKLRGWTGEDATI